MYQYLLIDKTILHHREMINEEFAHDKSGTNGLFRKVFVKKKMNGTGTGQT